MEEEPDPWVDPAEGAVGKIRPWIRLVLDHPALDVAAVVA